MVNRQCKELGISTCIDKQTPGKPKVGLAKLQLEIEEANRQFDLVLISNKCFSWSSGMNFIIVSDEYYLESLVLLSEELCWPIHEFAYFSIHLRAADKKVSQ